MTAHNQRIRCIGAFAGRQRTQHHACDHEGQVLFLFAKHARNVALCHVGQFVGHHRGQLITAGDCANQPQVHAQIAAGQRKGVDAFIAPQQHLPGKTLLQLWRQITARFGGLYQGLPDTHHIGVQLRVIDVVGIAVERANDAVAQAALFAGGEICPVAHARQRNLRVRNRPVPHGKTQGQRQHAGAKNRGGKA